MTFSAISFNNLLTTSSTIDSAILMISVAFFISGSARGSNGSCGGDSSAALEKINQFEVTKINDEAKGHKTIPICLSCFVASSAFSLLLERHEYLFYFSSLFREPFLGRHLPRCQCKIFHPLNLLQLRDPLCHPRRRQLRPRPWF
jgi:hypothetical protein